MTEDLKTQTEAVAGEKLPAEELNKLPQVNNQEETGFGGKSSMKQIRFPLLMQMSTSAILNKLNLELILFEQNTNTIYIKARSR